MKLKKLYIKIHCLPGWAIYIQSYGKYPANILSNFTRNSLEIDGVIKKVSPKCMSSISSK